MSDGSQRAGSIPKGWRRPPKIQFLFFSFFLLSSKKGEAGGLGTPDVWLDLSNEVSFFCS